MCELKQQTGQRVSFTWQRKNVNGRFASFKKARERKPIFVRHMPVSSQKAISETEKRMTIEENEGQYFFKKLCHIPPVPSFYSNHFHNTVTSEGACGSMYAFLTRLRLHKRKPRGDTEIKKGAGKKRVYRGDKRMSWSE